MRNPARRTFFRGAVVVGALVALPVTGRAQTANPAGAGPGEATVELKRLMKEGTAEYEREHWEAARKAFSEAWVLRKHYAVAANLGDVETRLGLYREAAGHLEYALANLPKDHWDRRAEAERLLGKCREHLGRIAVLVDVDAATVTLDGASVGQTPLSGGLWLEPGKHTLVIAAPGHETATREVTANVGGAEDIRITLTPTAAAAPVMPVAPAPAPAPAAPASSAPAPLAPASTADADAETSAPHGGLTGKTIAIVSGGVLSAAALTLGVVFRIRSAHASDDTTRLLAELDASRDPSLRNSACYGPATDPRCGAIRSKSSDAVDDRNLSTMAFVTGGVLAAATVSLVLLWPTAPSTERAEARFSPWVMPGEGAGADVHVRF